MGLRFRRSFKIAPGVRLNMGLRGASLSLGRRGAHWTVGTSGTTASYGIPGTGLSYVARSSGGAKRTPERSDQNQLPQKIDVGARISLTDEGTLSLSGEDGMPLHSKLVTQVFTQHGDTVRRWLDQYADKFNTDTKLLTEIHTNTPTPVYSSRFQRTPFEEPSPTPPTRNDFRDSEPHPPSSPKMGFFAKLLPGASERHAQKAAQARAAFELMHSQWQESKASHIARQQQEGENHAAALEKWKERYQAHEQQESQRATMHEQTLLNDTSYMAAMLERELSKLAWPRETNASFEVSDATVFLDIDLPEIEDMPKRTAIVNTNGKRMTFKEKSEKALREEYARHIHGVGFRLAGSTFAVLPAVHTVVISAYSQRLSTQTGHIENDYLYSTRIPRQEFAKINFLKLQLVDPIDALGAFEIRRSMTKTGIFKSIEPL